MSWVKTILDRLWNKTHGQPAEPTPLLPNVPVEQAFEKFLSEHEDRYHPRHALFGSYQLKGPDGVGYYYNTIDGVRLDVEPKNGTWTVYAHGKKVGSTDSRAAVEGLIEEALTAPPEA